MSIGGKGVGAADADDFAAARGAWAANPFERERLMEQGRADAGGEAMASSAIVRGTAFQFNAGRMGLDVWGAGGELSADGDHAGGGYEGEVSAYHVGFDRRWRDGGLAGVALAHMSAEMDLRDGVNDSNRLSADLFGVHPYLTRRWGEGARLWATVGYADGSAELVEEGAGVRRTGRSALSVLTASAGVEFGAREELRLRLGASISRAKLDGGAFANSNNLRFPTTTADTLRLTGGVEAGVAIAVGAGRVRPFVTADARRDTGDGDTGSAVDVGGGVEWRGDSLQLRLEGSGHLYGDGADEDSVVLTARRNGRTASPFATLSRDGSGGGVRWNAGRLSVDMELGLDENDLSLRKLLSGELRF